MKHNRIKHIDGWLDFNNIVVNMGDKRISIAQHWEGTTPTVQEVGIIYENESEGIEVFGYADTLDSLIETLIRVREQNV